MSCSAHLRRIGAKLPPACLAFLLAGALTAQHDEQAKKSKHPFIGDPKAIEAGRAIFASGCAACHGPDGKGGRGPNLRERVYWHPVEDSTIYDAVQKGIAGSMPPANLSEEQAWQVVAFVRALTAPAVQTPLARGDVKAGEELFWGKGGCGACHTVRGRGGALGPDLTNQGAARSLPQIREAILDPNGSGELNYRSVEVVLKNGQHLNGVTRDRTNYSLALQDKEGNVHLIPMSQVSKFNIGKTSPMPKDYKQRLSSREVDDLLAYLSIQSIREVKPEKKSE